MTRKPKVLMAEDEIIVAMSLADLLDVWGYEVCEIVSRAEDAVRKAGSEAPDIVLMDVNLQGETDGAEAAGTIRSRFGIPVILLSGYSEEGLLKRAKASGAGFLTKPLDLDKLKEMLDALVGKARAV